MPATLFIVEDDELIAIALRQVTTQLGYTVLGHATSGEAALEAVAAQRPDLVLMDINLAGKLDGIATSIRLREQWDVPVVFLSGHASDSYLQRAQEARPLGYLVKPIDDRELHATLQMAMLRLELEAELRRANAQLEDKVRERTAELAAKHEQLEDLLENATDLIQSVAPDGRLLFVNRAWREALGYTEAEVARLNLGEILASSCREHCLGLFESLWESRASRFVEAIFVTKGGRHLEVEGNVSARVEDGRRILTRGIFRDVTDRRQMERRFRLAVDGAPNAMIMVDAAGRILLANPRAAQLFGYRSEELLNQPVQLLVPEALRASHVEAVGAYARAPKPRPMGHGHELVGRRRDGSEVPIEVGLNPIATDEGPLTLASITDLTERKRTEAALRQSQVRLDLALAAVGMGVWHWDIVANRRVLDRQVCRLLGLDPDSFGDTAAEFFGAIHPEDVPRVKERIARVLASGDRYETEYRVVDPRGQVRHVQGRGHVVRDGSGQPLRLEGVLWDITSAKQAEAVLREHAERLTRVFLAAPTALSLSDARTGEFIDVNPRFASIVERPREALIGQTSLGLGFWLRPSDRERIMTAALDQESIRRDETVFVMPDGRHKQIGISVSLVEVGGRPCALTAIADITARKVAERALRDREILLSSIHANLTGACVYRTLHAPGETLRISYLSPTVVNLVGLPADRLIADPRLFFERLHPEDRSVFTTAINEALRSRGPASFTLRLFDAQGEIRWMQFRSQFVECHPDGTHVRDGVAIDITAHKRAEDEVRNLNTHLERLVEQRTADLAAKSARLETSEKLYRSLVESINHGYFVADHRSLFTYCNSAVSAVLGVPAESLLGTSSFRIVCDEDRPRVVAAYRDAVRAGEPVLSVEFRLRSATGRILWVEQATTIVRDAAGHLEGFRNVVRDISERKAAEERLRRSEERYRAVFDHSPIMIGLTSLADGRVLEFNAAAVTGFGYAREEAIGRTTVELGLWGEASSRDQLMGTLRQSGRVAGVETWLRRKGGERFRALFSATCIDVAGVPAVLSTVQDVTAQRETELRYRHMFENTPVGIYRTSPDGRVLLANPALATMLGYPSVEALAARNLSDPGCFAGHSRREFQERVEGTGELRGFETAWRRADGEVIHVSENVRVVRDETGQVLYYEGTAEDITARRKAEVALRESEAMFHGVFEASPIPILLSNAEDGTILVVNRAALVAFEHEPGEVRGRNTGQIGIWVRPEQRDEFFRRISTERSVQGFEAVMRTKSGQERIMLCNGTLLTVASRRLILASGIDITALRQAETEQARLQERMFQHQKFEALGTLAGGVAHDFNNILTGVINYTALAQADCPPSHPQVREFLNEVLACGERAKELVRQILLFSRAESGRKEPVLAQVILKEALALLRSTLPATAKIETEVDRQAPVVLANPTQLHQVIVNLVINAAQSLQGRPGQIRIRLQRVAVEADTVRALPDLQPGPHVRLEVTDSGCGMDEPVLARIFEPFFTTKPVGEGTGLGLAVVHSVVRNHQGAVSVRSRPGQGSTFEVYLPARPGPARHGRRDKPDLRRGRGEHVLLVDDERIAADSAKLLLDRLGYRVTVFSSPEAALAQFYVNPAFDVAILDYQMPTMTGVMLASRLLAHRPGLPIVMASGYAGGLTAEALQASGVTRLLPKPFELEELSRVLHEILTPRPPGPD